MTHSLSIAIVGAGALGLYYGARFVRAGHDVRFLLRSDLAAVRARNEITVRENFGDFTATPITACATAAECGPVDLVIITLKATANASLAATLPPLLGPRTAVLTLQNGLGAEDGLATLVGPERVLGGLCFIGVNRTAPGEVHGFHSPGSITLGEFNRPAGERARSLAATFTHAGVKCLAVDNLAAARWRKLIWNVPFNGLCITAGGVPTDAICADPALRAEVHALMAEVATAAAAHSVSIPASFLQGQYDVTPPMGPYRPSSLVDYLAGRAVEVEPIWGEPLRRAQAAGVPTPRLAALYTRLRELTREP